MPAADQARSRRLLVLPTVQGSLLGRDHTQHREDPEVRSEMRCPGQTPREKQRGLDSVFLAPQLPLGRLSEE